MSAGLFGLLDDVAALARLAAASVDDVASGAAGASVKAMGVVVDDTAVTPQYVHDIAAERELPIIKRIAVGSLRNKLLFILPAALVLSQFLPWLLTPILMVGGSYLCFEGAEKVWESWRGHSVSGHGDPEGAGPDADPASGEATEESVVAAAVRTDFILSAEIMVIALNEVDQQPFLARAVILAVVALLITALVYGVVALIVKMDDIGLLLAQRESPRSQRFGRGLVSAMPRLLAVIEVVGMAAMLWVGGHILLVGADDLGWHAPYSLVHHLEPAQPVLGWLVNTVCSAVAGLLVGAILAAALHLVPRRDSAHQSV